MRLYILKRLRKNIYYRYNKTFYNTRYPRMIEEYKKFKEIDKIYNEIIDVTMESV